MKQYKSLLNFTKKMQQGLNENSYKGGWKSLCPIELLQRIKEETEELQAELEFNTDEVEYSYTDKQTIINIQTECADIANFAMMLSDNLERGMKKRGGAR